MALPTTGYTIAGAASGTVTSPLPVANTIDAVNDYIPIYTNSLTATQAINRNTFLNLVSQPLGSTDTQNVSNKTISASTLTAPVINGNITGTYTLAGTPTFPASVATLTGSQTLTNKTLTSPTINSPIITNATLSSDAITGYTTSNAGSIFGVAITGGNTISTAMTLSSTLAVTGATTLSSTLAVSGIITSGSNPVWQYLGYAQITGNITTTSGTPVYATGLTATVTIPTGATAVKVTVYACDMSSSATTEPIIDLYSGASAGTLTTQLQQWHGPNAAPAGFNLMFVQQSPTAGAITYNAAFYNATSGDTTTIFAASTSPAFILVECC